MAETDLYNPVEAKLARTIVWSGYRLLPGNGRFKRL